MTDLIGRLRAHAEAHEHVAPQDGEQQQWMLDLREGADMIERLRAALIAACEIVQSDRVRLSELRDRAGGMSSVYRGRIALLDAVLRQADEALGVETERPE